MKELHAGQILTVLGGKWKGQGAQVRKVHEKTADVLISGEIKRIEKRFLIAGDVCNG